MIDELGLPPVCRQIPDVQPSDGHETLGYVLRRSRTSSGCSWPVPITPHNFPACTGRDGRRRRTDRRTPRTPGRSLLAEPWLSTCWSIVHDGPGPDDVDDASAAALPNAGKPPGSPGAHRQLRSGQSVLSWGRPVSPVRSPSNWPNTNRGGHVVAVGRNRNRLEALTEAGADRTIGIMDDLAAPPAIAKPIRTIPSTSCSTICGENPPNRHFEHSAGTTRRRVSPDTVRADRRDGPLITLAASTLRSVNRTPGQEAEAYRPRSSAA